MQEPIQEQIQQFTAQIREKHRLIAELSQSMDQVKQELRALEEERLARAPRGLYRHLREDRSEVTVEAAIIETDGAARRIWYQIPKNQAKRGEEDAYIRWLRTEEQLARLTERS